MKRTVVVLFIGAGVLGLAGLGWFAWSGGSYGPHALLNPAWGMQHHMNSTHGHHGMMGGWMQRIHQACVSWMYGSDAKSSKQTRDGPVDPEGETPSSTSSTENVESREGRALELRTTVQGGFAYRGASGSIRDERNPELVVHAGQEVTLKLINADGVAHDLVIPGVGIRSEVVSRRGDVATVRFTPEKAGSYAYYCSLPGHRVAGMEGRIVVKA